MLSQKRRNENITAVVSPDAIVCDGVTLEGDITIGPRCVVHPKAVIIAKDGPIVFGEGNLIEEYSRIVSRNPPGETDLKPLIIGDNNVFEVYSEFEGKYIGNNNVLESKASVGPMTKLSNGCVIGAACRLNVDETLPENVVVCGENYMRRVHSEKPQVQAQQLDFLRKILPNYHYLVKPKKTK